MKKKENVWKRIRKYEKAWKEIKTYETELKWMNKMKE